MIDRARRGVEISREAQARWSLASEMNPAMFKVLEVKGVGGPAAQLGRRYSTREQALVAVKAHLKAFKISGHNPEGNYWWVRDAEGLRNC